MAVQSPKKSSALPWPALIPLGHHAGKPAISLQKMVILVGSRHNAHLHLLSRHVSKAHALILSHGGHVYIRDLASREQVYINGVPEREAWLRSGDLIKIGSFTFKYKNGPTTGEESAGDAPPHDADLEIAGNDAPLAIAEKVMLIGRRGTCDIALLEESVSTAHAVIFHVGGTRYIRDLGSRTGTFVNGSKVHQHALSPGDAIRIGETEMRYALASEHEHAITPSSGDEIDELENLVGTAPLDMAAEIQRDGQVLPADLEGDIAGMFGAGGLSEASPVKDDDLIELEIAHEPQPAKGAGRPPAVPTGRAGSSREFPRPQPKAPPAMEPIELEPEAEEPAVEVTASGGAGEQGGQGLPIDDELDRLMGAEAKEPEAPAEPELVEIDLSKDPDVSDLPSAADTRAIGVEFEAEPVKPTVSDRVVDGPVEETASEAAHGGSADEGAAEAVPLEAIWPEDLVSQGGDDAASVTADADAEGISLRGGWRGLSRGDEIEAPVTDAVEAEQAALPVEEPIAVPDEVVDQVPPAAEEAAPAMELPTLETPSEEAVTADEGPAESAVSEQVVTPEAAFVEAPVIEPVTAEAGIAPEVTEKGGKKGRGRKGKAEGPVEEKSRKGKGGRKSKRQKEAELQGAVAEATVVDPIAVEPIEASVAPPAVGDLHGFAEPIPEAPVAEIAGNVAPASEETIDTTGALQESPEAHAETFPPEDSQPIVTEADVASPIEDRADFSPGVVDETIELAHEEQAAPSVADASKALSELPTLDEIDDLPPLEESSVPEPLQAAPLPEPVSGDVGDLSEVPAAADDAARGSHEMTPALDEELEEISLLEEQEISEAASPAASPAGAAAAAVDDDFFAGLEETLPVLELDSGELGPMTSDRDPDSLLAMDQIDLDGLEEIEVIESTEPTPASALDFNMMADDDATGAGATDDASLTDSTFGRQVEAFTSTSSGEIVEDLPEIEEFHDPEEELAIALGSDDERASESVNGATPQAVGDPGATEFPEIDANDGGIEPSAAGMVTDETLTPWQFAAQGEAVQLETPGVAEADAVLGGQAFVADSNGQEVAEEAEAWDEQSFSAEGNGHAPEPAIGASETLEHAGQNGDGQNGDVDDGGGGDVVSEEPIGAGVIEPTSSGPSQGGGGNFVIGTDLSSFIGGMPLVLPALAPPPTAFGRVQVSFAGAKAPWEQAQRPSFPMGQSLAEEVTDAAEGLRDVESMDEDLEPEPHAPAAVDEELNALGEGAPSDEWDLEAAALDPDQDEVLGSETATAVSDETEAPDELNVHASAHTIAELQPEAEPLEENQGLEAIDEDELLKELDAGGEMLELEPMSLDLEIEPLPELPEAEEEQAAPRVAEAPAAVKPPARPGSVGAIEQGEAELKAEAAVQGGSVVDRSPPPPVAPPKPAAAAPPAMVVPPPPARSLRARKGTDAPPAAPPPPPPALDGDAIFGSMEHGDIGGGGSSGAPFSGTGGVREFDVFSQGSPAAADMESPAARGGAGRLPPPPGLGEANVAATGGGTENRRPQRVIVPPRMGVLGSGAAAIDDESTGGGGGEPLTRPAYRVIQKKSVAKRVILIVLLMLICMGLAIGGIYYFYHNRQTTIGELQFQKTGALTRLQRDELRKYQFSKLHSPRLMSEARANAVAQAIAPGFLGDLEQFERGVKSEWPDDRQSTMTVSYVGPADLDDRRRLHALLMAMFTDNHTDLDREILLKSNIAKLQKRIEEAREWRSKRDEIKKVLDAAPSAAEIQKLEASAREADSAYDMAVAAVKDAQLEVRRAEEQLPAASPGERSLGAGGDAKSGAAADPEVGALQKALDEATSRITSVKGAASEEADAKRKMLDQAIELFQQSAAGLMKEDPQLAQYVQAVQQLQEQTHKLSGDLIEVQQQQHKRLSAIKKEIDDRVQARRTELWAADKTLSDLRARLDLAQRKLNAARDQNVDSRDLNNARAEADRLSSQIEGRKMELGNDPIVTTVADMLQETINVTKERLEADRLRIEKDIKDQERGFAQSNMVERLPEQQRAQAAALKAKQEAINDLRKQYAAALDKRTAESNASLRDLEATVSSVTAKIDERKRLLAADSVKNLTQQQEAQRKAALEQKQAALKQAEDRAATVRQAYAQASRALTGAMAKATERTAKQQELEAIDQSLAGKTDEESQDQRTLESLNDQLKTLVTVVKPVEASVRVEAGRDDRMLYSLGAVAGLAILFGVVAVVSVAGGGGEGGARRRGRSGEELEEDFAEAGPLAIEEIGTRAGDRKAQGVAG